MTPPFALGPGEGETIEGPAGGPLTFKARGEQTGGALTAVENVIAPGDGPPLHTHANEDEAWYVLEGRARLELGAPGERMLNNEVVGPGAAFHFPPGTVHRVTAVEDTTIIEVSTPQLDDIVRLEDQYGRSGQ